MSTTKQLGGVALPAVSHTSAREQAHANKTRGVTWARWPLAILLLKLPDRQTPSGLASMAAWLWAEAATAGDPSRPNQTATFRRL